MFNIFSYISPESLPVDSIPSVSTEVKDLRTLSIDEFLNRIVSIMVDFAIHLAIAIFVFYVGKFVIRKLFNVTTAMLLRRNVDRSLSTFILSLVKIVLYFILIVTVIGIIGINTTSLLALFTSAGVAVGLALSGTLQNFAGGVLILLLKPYKVGDYIEAQGFAGTVTEIQIFHTLISTTDNKSIIIPNGVLSTGSINNWSREAYRRVSWDIAISYGDDFDKARSAIIDLLLADPRVIKDADDANARIIADNNAALDAADTADAVADSTAPPRANWFMRLIRRREQRLRQRAERDKVVEQQRMRALRPVAATAPAVYLSTMADSSIQLSVRAWVSTPDYWSVYYHFNEVFYKTLPQHSINFPFPQLDVHISSPQ